MQKVQSIRGKRRRQRIFPEKELRKYIDVLGTMNRLTLLRRKISRDLRTLLAEAEASRNRLILSVGGLDEHQRQIVLESFRLSPEGLWGQREEIEREMQSEG